VSSTALILADWSQTLQIIREPHTRHEGNPLLGRHPSEGRVNTMVGLAVTANLAAFLVPKRSAAHLVRRRHPHRGRGVTHNLTNGLSIGF